ncbi:hypothetical protein ACFU93_32540 [Streptomyces sp. NPDC057611]|uniref:hypothetical protein n=1 Tax=Streptomyces sp. NPDC057611 TaxID=3346182 RepID=UPI0036896C0E
MATNLTPLAPGTKLATVGTFYPAKVVTSEVGPAKFFKGRLVRKTVIRWTASIPAAGVREGDTEVWAHIEGRFPRFVVTADN